MDTQERAAMPATSEPETVTIHAARRNPSGHVWWQYHPDGGWFNDLTGDADLSYGTLEALEVAVGPTHPVRLLVASSGEPAEPDDPGLQDLLLAELAAEVARQDRSHPSGYPATRDGVFLGITTAVHELEREAVAAWQAERCGCEVLCVKGRGRDYLVLRRPPSGACPHHRAVRAAVRQRGRDERGHHRP